MATATNGPEVALPRTPGLRPYRITVEVYQRIADSGAFGDKSSVFLWKGQLVEKVADDVKGRPHVVAVNELRRVLGAVVDGRGYFVEQDQPIALGDHSTPEPDLKYVRGAIRDYSVRIPSGRDCPLVVEVADSSPPDDRGLKLRAYAESLIPVYWVVNLLKNRIDVHSRPGRSGGEPGYEDLRSSSPDEDVPVVLDGREVGRGRAGDVLP